MIILSIHDLPRRSTFFPEGVFRPPSFQFTTSRGGRLPSHQWLPNTLPFNSRPPEEVDADGEVIEESQIPFNSRPPEEVDWLFFRSYYCMGLSIHDLPRRSTYGCFRMESVRWPFNSRPPEEVDCKIPQFSSLKPWIFLIPLLISLTPSCFNTTHFPFF